MVKEISKIRGVRTGKRLVLAIPITISGEDARGQHFSEQTHTLVLSRRGAGMRCSRELKKDSMVKVTILPTNRTAAGRVAYVGEKAGAQWEIGIEIPDAENFWGVQFPAPDDSPASKNPVGKQQVDPKIAPQAGPTGPAKEMPPASQPELAPSVPELLIEETDLPPLAPILEAARSVPEPFVPAPFLPPVAAAAGELARTSRDPLADTFRQMVDNAIEESVRPAVERISAEMAHQMAQAESESLQGLREQMEALIGSHAERLELRAIDVITRNTQALDRNVEKAVNSGEQTIRQREQAMAQKVGEATRTKMVELALSSKAQLQKDASDTISGALAGLRESIRREMPDHENRFAEFCRQQASQLSARVDLVFNKLDQRQREAEASLAEMLDRQSQRAADQLAAELSRCCEQALAAASAQAQKRLEETTAQVGQSFLRHIVGELNKRQEEWLEQAMKTLDEASQQTLLRTRRELARIMKDLGKAMSAE